MNVDFMFMFRLLIIPSNKLCVMSIMYALHDPPRVIVEHLQAPFGGSGLSIYGQP